MLSVCYRCVIGSSSGLSVCCRLRYQHCADDRFPIGVMSVIYRSQIGRFHTEAYPKWLRNKPDWFYGVFSNIIGGRQLADSLTILRFLSVSCRFGRCDLGIKLTPCVSSYYTETNMSHLKSCIFVHPHHLEIIRTQHTVVKKYQWHIEESTSTDWTAWAGLHVSIGSGGSGCVSRIRQSQ